MPAAVGIGRNSNSQVKHDCEPPDRTRNQEVVQLSCAPSYPWSNMGDSLHSDGKNELVTGYVPCICACSSVG